MTLDRPDGHLEVNEIAAYVDRTATSAEHRAIEAHLADCDACRAEVADVAAVVRGPRRARLSGAWTPALAAAAAIAIIALVPGVLRDRTPVVHRDEAPTMTVAPRLIFPIGQADSVGTFLWSAVPSADRYRVRLFDPGGTMLWEHETSDTTTVVAPSVSLRRGSTYYWRVESHSGFDRWSASDLVEFVR